LWSPKKEEGHPQGVPLQMTYNPDIHHRRSIRLREYDYSQPGAYYVSICIQGHKCLLGEIALGQMNQNHAGEMVERAWKWIPRQFPTTELDEHIVMPNHFHGILRIVGAPLVGAQVGRGDPRGRLGETAERVSTTMARRQTRAPTRGAPTLGEMIGAFKSITTDEYIRGVREQGWARFSETFWQRNFYEHIVRNEAELEKIRDYIRRNPLMWAVDRYNPDRVVPVIDEEGRVVPWDES